MNALERFRDEQVVSRGNAVVRKHKLDAKLCAHFADVCLRAAEQEADDPAYHAMLLDLAAEWLIDAEASMQSTRRQRGKRGRARLSRRSPQDTGKKSGRLLTTTPPAK